jgi:hypothetical protein
VHKDYALWISAASIAEHCYVIARPPDGFVTAALRAVGDDAPMSDTEIRSGLGRRGLPTESNQFSRKVWRPLWRPGVAFDDPPVERPDDPLRGKPWDEARRGPSPSILRPQLKRSGQGSA